MEKTLLQRVADGEVGAVKACMNQYAGLVWSLARRMSPTSADAEDAVQEIFVSIWKNADRFDPKVASETTYVAMIARRRLIDRARKDGRRPTSVEIVEHPSASPGESRSSVTEQVDLAEQVLEELSQDQQKVLRLAIFQGLSHEKIAKSIDMPLGTVKTHVRRGLMKAREIIAERGTTDGSTRSVGAAS